MGVNGEFMKKSFLANKIKKTKNGTVDRKTFSKNERDPSAGHDSELDPGRKTFFIQKPKLVVQLVKSLGKYKKLRIAKLRNMPKIESLRITVP